MPEIPSLLDMLKAGMHFGHQASRWHPKMEPYIFGARNDVHIINLEVTQDKLRTALGYVRDLAARGGTILLVGTKRQAQDIVKREAQRCGMPYVTLRWLGGTLTNFTVLNRLFRDYRDLKEKLATGGLEKYTKLEQLEFSREAEDMERRVGGIVSLDKIPEALFILDIKKEKTAYLEAQSKGVPVVAVVDTNVDPTGVAYPIPANDDAVRSIEMIVTLIADAVLEGKAASRAAIVESKPAALVSPVAEPATV
ncbi:30S ribosomal protein S2 [Candidatus Uhrbacteria bacterium RIFCSPHIGHO2_02_FULL_57_19]|uniref:Small ribosomal subunit protein uS2 n=1 Tax=Candidatus Uhrbacteria bacterium RIFCSPHIGHO2_02_FULL_57_19 TaxID=1802391 RepID=A0A1F7U8B9_9BACT|nr:MAG: 30S ribosomal protein S2 [Candidatus Uhrbacteria bacterium RIFCSPHIGHO2_02_FULL_57_19]